jgi:hypothetical protein
MSRSAPGRKVEKRVEKRNTFPKIEPSPFYIEKKDISSRYSILDARKTRKIENEE